MSDRSLLEGGNPTRSDQHSGFAFGRITKVYPEERLCEVKTFGGGGPTNDNHIPKCQWLSLFAHAFGDELTIIPRVDSYGLVFYVDGEPFIFGYFAPLSTEGSAQVGEEKVSLNEGDFILKTVGKNNILMLSSGIIQIEATKRCRTIYFPEEHRLNTLCANYELRTDGGTVDWINLGDDTTYFAQEYRDDTKRSHVVIEERGSVDGDVISRTTLGTGAADGGVENTVWEHQVRNTGETDFFVHAPGAEVGHKLNIKPSGDTTLDVGGKCKVTILATGETKIDVGPGKAVLTITPDGAVTLTNEGTLTTKTTGAVSMETSAGLTIKTGAAANVKIGGAVTIEASGKGTFKASQIELNGGGSLEQVLTTPSAVSQFTGLPLQVGSSSVKASN